MAKNKNTKFSSKSISLEALNAAREIKGNDDFEPDDHVKAWLGWLDANIQANPSFMLDDLDNYNDEIEAAIASVVNPRDRLGYYLTYMAYGASLQQKFSQPKGRSPIMTGGMPQMFG